MRKLVLLLFVSTHLATALAQDTKSAAASGTASVPKHSCKRPEKPADTADTATQRTFRREVDGYRECLMSYGEDMRAAAKAHMDAGNAAIKEFNDYVDQVQSKK